MDCQLGELPALGGEDGLTRNEKAPKGLMESLPRCSGFLLT